MTGGACFLCGNTGAHGTVVGIVSPATGRPVRWCADGSACRWRVARAARPARPARSERPAGDGGVEA